MRSAFRPADLSVEVRGFEPLTPAVRRQYGPVPLPVVSRLSPAQGVSLAATEYDLYLLSGPLLPPLCRLSAASLPPLQVDPLGPCSPGVSCPVCRNGWQPSACELYELIEREERGSVGPLSSSQSMLISTPSSCTPTVAGRTSRPMTWGWASRSSAASSMVISRSSCGTNDERTPRSVVLPELVPPEITRFKRPRTQAARNPSILNPSVPFASSSAGPIRMDENLRTFSTGPQSERGGTIACTRCRAVPLQDRAAAGWTAQARGHGSGSLDVGSDLETTAKRPGLVSELLRDQTSRGGSRGGLNRRAGAVGY